MVPVVNFLTNRGRYFMSRVVGDILRSFSTERKIATAYHLQTNWVTERLNRTLTDMLSMYVSPDHKDWDLALPYVTFAYNTSRHDTTGYSRFYLLYGRHVVLPLDTLVSPADRPVIAYARDAIAQAADTRQIARSRLQASQQAKKSLYDNCHRHVTYEPGLLVLLWSPSHRVGLSEKLLSPYNDPYSVVRQVTDVTYEVAPHTPASSTCRPPTDNVHVMRLKPYHVAS
ncbi:uncharacterized protein LOC144108737 [Amblyomma americanum]